MAWDDTDNLMRRRRSASRLVATTRTCRLCGAKVYETDLAGFCGTCHHDGFRAHSGESHPEIERRIGIMRELAEKKMPLCEGVP